jgi:hypothetical protein
MPSWVPNWFSTVDYTPFSRQSAHGSTVSNLSYLGDGLLQVTSIQLTIIAEIIDFSRVSTYSELIKAIRSLVPIDAMNRKYFGRKSILDAYCRTLRGNYFKDYNTTISINTPAFDESLRGLRAVLTGQSDGDITPTTQRYLDSVTDVMSQRFFILTEGGYIGYCSPLSEPGD